MMHDSTENTLFTSEAVSNGHPDKVADQISDAILDAILVDDPNARVACETLVKTGMVLVSGEIMTNTWVDIEAIVRETLRQIGYDRPELGFHSESVAVLNVIGKQSADIAKGVEANEKKPLGAGDQGLMFGYASDETPAFMPAAHYYAQALMRQHQVLRQSNALAWLRPDAKCQLTLRYENKVPVAVETVVFSTQHAAGTSHEQIVDEVMSEIIQPVLPDGWLHKASKFLINPAGPFVIGGPQGDCGLTGRKIIVDTYGGYARHGGGAMSGKDASKVDRTAAYMARWIAKHVVAAGFAKHCEVQLAYAIGQPEPVSIRVETFGTGTLSEAILIEKIKQVFPLDVSGMIESLGLTRPIFLQTAGNGHFGQVDSVFPWESLNKLTSFKEC